MDSWGILLNLETMCRWMGMVDDIDALKSAFAIVGLALGVAIDKVVEEEDMHG